MTNFLTKFDFDLIYNTSKTNAADCLSRNPVLNADALGLKLIVQTVNLLTLSQIIKYQRNINTDKKIITKQEIKYRINNDKN